MANSSVLISLSAIQQLDLLHKRFPEILIPQAVWQEVVVKGKGQPGAQEAQSSDWIKVGKVKDQTIVQLLQADLDQGESEVIALAREVGADLVLLDEKDARLAAERVGLKVLGTIGILIRAKKDEYILSLREQLDALRDKAEFRLSAGLYQQALESVSEDSE